MCILLREVATSYRTILPLVGLNSFKSVYKMSGDHCSTQKANQMFSSYLKAWPFLGVSAQQVTLQCLLYLSYSFGLKVQKVH